ncbi:MAG: 3'-5' exonuclease [Chloroflexi bacterium]|nr:MAG: 3'-5' exonuclease [Chloroflexota bacterium]MBL1196617.1 3'-5' exonuclease [Chloroflexota bacterium]NOH13910.1 3'-5' exonuclease [Chloroflexota bacterium]
MPSQALLKTFPDYPAFISVDVETAGTYPRDYAMLSIGACTIPEPRQTFYIELKPDKPNMSEGSAAVHGLSMEELKQNGIESTEALQRFEGWLGEVVPGEATPIFVALNAPFDWMFVNDYFMHYLGRNPFGHKALDMKAFFMGLHHVPWGETGFREMGEHYLKERVLVHNALQDAIDQAEMFQEMLEEAAKNPKPTR